jgi:hypothetical protein
MPPTVLNSIDASTCEHDELEVAEILLAAGVNSDPEVIVSITTMASNV